jgi:hypothetical protein
MLYLLHHQDDDSPDDYVSRPFMTVLGFGRSDKEKYLTQPQSFSIGFVESDSYLAVERKMHHILANNGLLGLFP